ncbi:NAD(P)/FAD-dependent oxidoreductase [Mycolicibacterium vaccae]|uniref:NAD(P)/FAD-dependent oxidoreductase n=1 Tax=Mycolicibacterium vaccae TaxID=1810 RepID=UPI0009D95D6F|nr:FAD-dependent oxidoreductase [Mycolicibacterium vaccae]MCV7061262.1 FAD-dependent oxidoreductase [Mycolicibacterium vaccae]
MPDATSSRVLVIGGGVIGLSAAHHLARAGHQVTLIERTTCGHAASWGNAGWIVPSLVQPFNAPGAVPQALRAALNPKSPIAIRQIPTWSLARWGLAFLRNSRPDRSRGSLQALAAMAAGAAEDVSALAEELGFETHRTGLLVPFRSQPAWDAYLAAHAEVESAGYRGRTELLTATEMKNREPALAGDIIGGVYLPDEVSVRPDAMTAALATAFQDSGGALAEHESVVGIDHSGRDWQVTTSRRALSGDAVVLAAGEHTAALARMCGVRLPLQSGRGCSVTLPPILQLRGPVKIAEDRIACTPFTSGEVRISGTFDLVRPGAGTARGRMRAVLDAAAVTLPALRGLDISDVEIWSGARPCTPDSLPVVGPAGNTPGLFVASGHGTLGMTLAVNTGRAITAMVGATVTGNISKGQTIL